MRATSTSGQRTNVDSTGSSNQPSVEYAGTPLTHTSSPAAASRAASARASASLK